MISRSATPPEFGSGVEGVWSPEDLLVASAATCFAVTLSAIARRRDIALTSMHVAGVGHLGPLDDGGFGFASIELDVDVGTETTADLAAAEDAVERAAARLPRGDGAEGARPRQSDGPPRRCDGCATGRLTDRHRPT